MRPKHLAIALSKLAPHPCQHLDLEQYATEGDLAAYWMLGVDQLDGIEGKRVLDIGAGNGILGIACLLLGAEHVTMVEVDPEVVKVINANVASLPVELQSRTTVVHGDVREHDLPTEGVDLVVMNPPWGTQVARADRPFLDQAFATDATAVHLLHHANAAHLEAVGEGAGWRAEVVLQTEFRLPPTYFHHAQRKGFTDVKCWRFFRPGDARLDEVEA